ncbi:ATP synthase subunit J [Rhypophila sp. PSN 637]|uniref:ATP synthase subunit J n=1 Tax=Rhypophila decipiens TaxID=261697 RepID=A0AAN6Y3X2_9PEZI|nr:ATP synthase subunit J [Rhypophila decipiens]
MATWFGIKAPKKFPAPVLRPMAPFFAAGLIVAYGINGLQNSLMGSPEFRNDPRNPNVRANAGH